MSSLLEEYNEIYKILEGFRQKIDEYHEEIKGITHRRDDEIPKRIENLQNQLKKIDDYQLKIHGFIDLAEKHMKSKNLPTIEAPEGYRVNVNRLRSLAMLIDPLSEDDSYAQRVYLIANCDLKFLDKKKADFESKIVELDNDYAVGAPDEIKRLEGVIDSVKQKRREFLESERFTDFSRSVISENEKYMYLNAPESFSNESSEPPFWVPGAYGTVLDGDSEDRQFIKSHIGRFYDENSGRVYLPVKNIPSGQELAMVVKCVPARKRVSELDAGIRNLIFDQINSTSVGLKKVYVFDALRQNASVLGSLKDLEESGVIAPTPHNPEQIEDGLKELCSTFDDIDEMLGNHETVIDYNNSFTDEKKITRSFVVFVGWPDSFSGESVKLIQRIITNYERYGISFIAVKIESSNKDDNTGNNNSAFGLSDYVGENIISVNMSSNDSTLKCGTAEEHAFIWYGFKYLLNENYVKSFNECKKKSNSIGNEFPKRHPMNVLPEYTRAYKPIKLPFGIDGKDQECFVSFENENFAAYLVGASRSGKSTLLHTLIAGLIMNFHPDNLELWLADFKQLEFKKYIRHMPPHVKYILLDESPELVYDLINKLTDKMMERQRLFAQMGVERIDQIDTTKLPNPLPVIFVILDEFSIMSQSIAQDDTYKIRLQNLLAKGAALGIKFIFSSQTFTSGVNGLTLTARAQIQQRIAMKGTLEEITETLELTSNIKTEKVVHWMEALPPHYALIKHRISADTLPEVNRVLVSYIPDYSVRDNLITMISDNMKSVDEYDPGSINTYKYKDPVVLDGNSYDSYDSKIDEFNSRIQSMKSDALYSGDEMFLNLGTPRRMESLSPIVISPETGENIMFITGTSEMVCSCAIINSALKSYASQNGKVQIWAYDRNRIYRIYKDVWNCYDILTDPIDVAERISEISDSIDEKQEDNELIVILGLDRFITELELLGSSGSTVKKKSKVSNSSGSIIDKLKKTGGFTDDKEEMSLDDFLNSQGFADDNPTDNSESDIDDNVNENTDTEKTETDVANESVKNDESVKPADTNSDISVDSVEQKSDDNNETSEYEDDSDIYNTDLVEELNSLIKQGSRQGHHFLVIFNSMNDLKHSHVKLDYFRHRLSFAVNKEDSWALFSNNSAASMPEHICRYSDTQNTYSFRPYLHREFCWDGWIVNENGQAETIKEFS